MLNPQRLEKTVFDVILIKPTHYDDQGYPIQWLRSVIPSNSLACVYGLTLDCQERMLLGPEVEIRITAIDESNRRVRPKRLIRQIEKSGGKGMLALVGVQSNQFPRALDIAQPFLAKGVPVCIGGFHVSGCLSMLKDMPEEMRRAQEMGISFFAGEAESDRLAMVLRDAYAGTLKPIYNFLEQLPALDKAPVPFLPASHVKRTYGTYGSFDLGRGCPFQCSFCTIINVQGRVSRFRTADDLERIVRENHRIGVDRFFVTDDNLARNRNWEACFDRLIELREREGIKIRMMVQVDMLCHRIPGFVDKGVKAGIDQVFVGMETIHPDSLTASKKAQNRITEYRDVFLAWKKYPVVITAGYILGFPNDTKESILRDIEIVKHDLPIDIIYLSFLTPLPGCEDHRNLLDKGVWMDPDLNKYDLNHRVTHHPRMSDKEWEEAYDEVWKRYYTYEHMETVFKRMVALRSDKKYTTLNRLAWYRDSRRVYGIHPLEGGVLRMKFRRDRRPSFRRDSVPVFYAKYAAELIGGTITQLVTRTRLWFILRRVLKDPHAVHYRDEAITRSDSESADLSLIVETRGTDKVIQRERARKELLAATARR
jgi:hypothetical protein